MFLVLSALAYLAVSIAAVLGIDFAIGHRYRPHRTKNSAAPAYARATPKGAVPPIRH